jgi:adenylate kinase family enzyme
VKLKDKEETLEPRRIYIHGRPGVGKTTLCKKAVHDCLHQGVWKDLFDRILWIPLRNLTSHNNEYDLAKLLRDEFFSQCVEEDKTNFTKAIINECEHDGKEH